MGVPDLGARACCAILSDRIGRGHGAVPVRHDVADVPSTAARTAAALSGCLSWDVLCDIDPTSCPFLIDCATKQFTPPLSNFLDRLRHSGTLVPCGARVSFSPAANSG